MKAEKQWAYSLDKYVVVYAHTLSIQSSFKTDDHYLQET